MPATDKLILGPVLVALTLPLPAAAQSNGDGEQLDAITVTTTRTSQGRPLSSIPGSVQIIEEEEIQEQARGTEDLGEILSNLVPGFGLSSEQLTNAGQQLRGRDFLVMIDGVPQNASLRQASKFLRTIAPEAIERVEVIRGSVATYGYGATGGIVNFITKSGEGLDGSTKQTTVGISGQTADSDSLGSRIYQGVRGDSGAFDYSLNVSAKRSGVHYDGEGDVIPPDGLIQGGSLSESSEYNLQTKLGYQLDERQRLRLSLNHYDREQDADYHADRTTGDNDPNEKITAEDGSPQGSPPGTKNTNLSLDYTAEQVAGGTLSTQLYHQDYETVFSYYDGYPSGGGQSRVTTEHTGLRLTHERGFGGTNAVYGIDVGQERTGQDLLDGRSRVPELEQTSYAPFVQLEVPAGQDWLLRAGVRHESATVDVPTFQDESLNNPGTVQGGELDYSESLLNLGAVYFVAPGQEVFVAYSEGFSLSDIGRALRGHSSDVDAEELDPEAQVVQNYELGWRGRFDRFQGSVTAFMNASDLGTTFGGPPDFQLQRRKERVFGLEVIGDYEATETVQTGGTFTWQEGFQDTNDDSGIDDFLPSTRITPPEMTTYVEYEPSGQWSTRLQAKHVFDRGRFDDGGYPNGDVDGFTLLDLGASMQAGPGRVHLTVTNLTDRQYIVPVAQAWNLAGRMVAGRGRAFNAQYTMEW